MNFQQFWEYNCKDAAVTLESWQVLSKELDEKQMTQQHNFCLELVEPLVYMSLRGIRVNETGMKTFSDELEEEYDLLAIKLKEIVGTYINPNSTKQLQTYFYVSKGVKPYISRATGRMTVDEEALKKLFRKGFEEAALMLRMREIKKLKSSYLDIKYDEDGRMRCSYNPAGTTTGRLSSSKTIFGAGLNLQTVPKAARGFFVADEGMELVEVDLSQAEARVVAYLAGDPQMISVFENNGDIHNLTADLMKTDRQTAKTINHASNYAMGANKLSLLLGCSKKEATDLMLRYHMVYPGIRSTFHKTVEASMRQTRSLVNLFGRKRTFYDLWSEDLLRAGYAYIPQSTVAELTNRGLVKLYQANFDILAQVHDSVLLQVSKETFDPTQIKALMEEPITYRDKTFTIPAGVKHGPNWREMQEA
jgi:DNA polymerase I